MTSALCFILLFCIVPFVLSALVELGAIVLAPNKDKVCFPAEILEFAKDDNAVKVRFLATKGEASVKGELLLKPSEWLGRDELVLVQEPEVHNASVYEEVKIVDIVDDAGNLPRYRVRVEAPSIIYHKMIEMKYIGVSQKKVGMVLDRARKDGLLWPWIKTVFVESLVVGIIVFFFLSGQRKRAEALALSAGITVMMFIMSTIIGLGVTQSNPGFCERYFTLF